MSDVIRLLDLLGSERIVHSGRAEDFEERGHAPHLEDPERYERVVLEFLFTLSRMRHQDACP